MNVKAIRTMLYNATHVHISIKSCKYFTLRINVMYVLFDFMIHLKIKELYCSLISLYIVCQI